MPAAAAPITFIVVIQYIIWGILIVIAIMFLWDCAKKIWIAIAKPPCGLYKHWLMADECSGACTTPSVCVATRTKPYFWGAFGVQDAACACGAAGSGIAGGTGAPTTAGPSAAVQKAKDGLKPAEKHTEDTDKAIDDSSK